LQSSFQRKSKETTNEYGETITRYERLRKTIEWQDYEQNEIRTVASGPKSALSKNDGQETARNPLKPLDLGWTPEDLGVFLRHYIQSSIISRHITYLDVQLKVNL
jgi:hypothetical protein